MKKILSNPTYAQNIFYISFTLLATIVSIIVGVFYNYNFLYSYLISLIFTISCISTIFFVDQKPLWVMNKLKRRSKKSKFFIIFIWKLKYLWLVFYLIFCIISINKKIIFINILGLCYGAIILLIIVLISEILRVYYYNFEIKKKGKEVVN